MHTTYCPHGSREAPRARRHAADVAVVALIGPYTPGTRACRVASEHVSTGSEMSEQNGDNVRKPLREREREIRATESFLSTCRACREHEWPPKQRAQRANDL